MAKEYKIALNQAFGCPPVDDSNMINYQRQVKLVRLRILVQGQVNLKDHYIHIYINKIKCINTGHCGMHV